jgi:hypothetical protein
VHRDIFIDNGIARCFCNPIDPEYKRLYKWLETYDPSTPSQNAYLMTSNKIINEYNRTCANTNSDKNIAVLINKLLSEGRTKKIHNDQIKEFQREHFKPHIKRRLKCNRADHDHIPVVLLSDRRYALSSDPRFRGDINSFPSFNARAERRPQDLPYDQ